MRRIAAAAAVPAVAALVALAGCGSSNNTASPGSSFCDSAKNLNALTTVFGGSSGTDLNATKTQLQGLTSAVDSMDGSAPSDISADMHTLRQAIDDANSKVQSASSIDQVGAAFDQSNSAALDAAGNKVTAYVQSKCGINLNGSTSTGT